MPKGIIIGFLISTLLLVGFEYIFLTEIYTSQRPLFMLAGLGGVLLSAVFFFVFFVKFRRTSDDN